MVIQVQLIVGYAAKPFVRFFAPAFATIAMLATAPKSPSLFRP